MIQGGRVLRLVLGQPFKCPPAPFEGRTAGRHFTQQIGRRGITTTFDSARSRVDESRNVFGRPGRRIRELPQHLVTSIDPATRTAQLASGETLGYDLFIGIPVHRAPSVCAGTELVEDDWVPVDQSNLRTRFPGVYALGDVSSGPRTVPKAGIFAEAAAAVVAEDIAATISGGASPAPYEASGVCYAEFGGGLVSKVEVSFLRGDSPERAAPPQRRSTVPTSAVRIHAPAR